MLFTGFLVRAGHGANSLYPRWPRQYSVIAKNARITDPQERGQWRDELTQARGITSNLSEVVESLLADFLTQEKGRRAAEAKVLKEAIQTWNTFAEKHGSFADEHLTL